jgi:putative ABC transport system permease protein
MFINYLKIAFRNLIKHRGYSIINILGLSIGMGCFLLITLWILDEISYDQFHKNSSDLFIVVNKSYSQNGIAHRSAVVYPVAQELKRDYPEILDVSRVYYSKELLFVHNDKRFIENRILIVDPEFLSMFSFPLIYGDANLVLDDPKSVVITKKIAQKYFGNADPVGQTFRVHNQYDLIVTGILDEPPHNSHLDFSILVPLTSEVIKHEFETDRWRYSDVVFGTYVLLQKNQIYNDVSKKIAPILQKHIEDCKDELYLYPITKLHTNPDIAPFESRSIDMMYINIFIVIAFLVLLIACINFMNLSTARSTIRAQEIGMRKVVGASRIHLVMQFLGESILIALIAVIIATILVYILLPTFNTFSGKELSLNLWDDRSIFYILISMTLFTGIVAGSYPALFLSAFQPITVFKGKLMVDFRSSILRKIFVVVQFSLSICFIIGAVVFYDQLNYMKNREVGYDKENLISIPIIMPWLQSLRSHKYDTFQAELMNYPNIIGVTQSFSSPADIATAAGEADWEGKYPNQSVSIHWLTVHYDYCKTLGIEIIEGRPFSRDFATDVFNDRKVSFIVNEETVKLMGVKSAIGLKLTLFRKTGPIIGVMRNFHYHHMKTKIEPLALFIMPYFNQYILIKLQPENIKESLEFIKKTWEKFSPDYPFEHSFVSEDYNSLYRHEEKMGKILTIFTVFAIFIACLGLWGLTSFIIERRTKEIGIRKVLGASVLKIIILLSKEFLNLVIIANIIAWPLVYYFINVWLQNFAYRVNIGFQTLLVAGSIVIIVAFLAISYQTLRAAIANPVESLRYE